MSLHAASSDLQAKAKAGLGDTFNILSADIDRVRTSGTLDHALRVGQTAPDFTLPDAFGKQVALRDLLARGPVVLSFYRGEWCPFCNLELHALQQVLPSMQALGATLVAISPEKPDFGVIATEKNQLTFPVLSDLGNRVARQFGIVFQVGPEVRKLSLEVFKNDFAPRNGDSSYELPVPATFVLDSTGTVRFAHVDPDYQLGRAEPQTILASLQTLAPAQSRGADISSQTLTS